MIRLIMQLLWRKTSLKGRCVKFSVLVRLCLAVFATFCGFVILYNATLKEDGPMNGWKELLNHYAIDFVSPNEYTALTVVNNPCTRSKPPTLLIIVTSAVENIEKRRTIRETWGSRTKNHSGNVEVLFLVGRSKHPVLNDKVINENDEYGDVIVENFVDAYYNLTIKSIMVLKFLQQNCSNVAFAMKMDDDVYLNIDNLMKFLSKEYVSPNNFLMGKLYSGLEPDRRITSKWYVPEHVYPSSSYPDYLCGVGFIMSRDVVARLYEESFTLKLYFLEDVFITGTCAEKANIKRKNHVAFHFFEHAVEIECNSVHPHMILLSHYTNSEDMRKMHSQLMGCQKFV